MTDDPLWDALRALPQHAEDPRREARVRAACRARIARCARRKRIVDGVLQGATAAAVLAYVTSVLSVALRLAMSSPAR